MKIKDKRFLTKGHRALIYTANYKGKKGIIKIERKDIKAVDRIKNEIKWLKVLNKFKIGPKLISHNKNYFICEFIEGERIIDWLKKADKKDAKKVLKEILKQCRILDKLKVNKEELHNPYKHILIYKNKARMIDFERCHQTLKPKNITQFCQFLMSLGFKIKKEDLKNYKNKQTEKNFKTILNCV